ncbi:MAG: hypothetical protein IKT41_01985 [Clostridia bacterium]|nr:hypothetical protein [Clostridia bacterium]
MTPKGEAREFLENCRILMEGEELKKGNGIAVLFNKDDKEFVFVEYNNSEISAELQKIGGVTIEEIITEVGLDADAAILKFKEKASAIVGKREYKIEHYVADKLWTIPSAVAFIKRCQEKNLDIENEIRIIKMIANASISN